MKPYYLEYITDAGDSEFVRSIYIKKDIGVHSTWDFRRAWHFGTKLEAAEVLARADLLLSDRLALRHIDDEFVGYFSKRFQTA
jgi:hypothetical protein